MQIFFKNPARKLNKSKRKGIMTEKEKEENINEPNNEEIKLPQLHYVVMGNCYIHTAKGLCIWTSPVGVTLEENIENLKYTISVYEKQIEINKQKEKEESEKNKPPSAETNKADYKAV